MLLVSKSQSTAEAGLPSFREHMHSSGMPLAVPGRVNPSRVPARPYHGKKRARSADFWGGNRPQGKDCQQEPSDLLPRLAAVAN